VDETSLFRPVAGKTGNAAERSDVLLAPSVEFIIQNRTSIEASAPSIIQKASASSYGSMTCRARLDNC